MVRQPPPRQLRPCVGPSVQALLHAYGVVRFTAAWFDNVFYSPSLDLIFHDGHTVFLVPLRARIPPFKLQYRDKAKRGYIVIYSL